MARKEGFVALVAMLVAAGAAVAQSTGTPAFNAPYRAFGQHEFGGTVSFTDGGGMALEGAYGFGTGRFDVGLRGGFWDSDATDTQILIGAGARQRLIEHTEAFPLDGAVVVGLGARLASGANTVIIPGGLSLGRRLDVEDSQVSIIPYVQPTVFLTAGENQDTELNVAFGFGGDFRLSRLFDARVSVGLGDIEGVSISAVWVR